MAPARPVEAHPWVEASRADESGDETIVGDRRRELIVHLQERGFEIGAEPNAMRGIGICVTESAGAMPCPVASPRTVSSPWSSRARSKVSPRSARGRDVP
jgi:hypothetical protein